MEKLRIEYVDINSIKPYKYNAKLHPQEQINQIKESIDKFGMDDPIGIWKDEIVEGHGRLLACKELGYTEVPIIRLDHLTDEERKAYTLIHNKLTMNSDFDIDILNQELIQIETIDMESFGFEISPNLDDVDDLIEDEAPEIKEEPKSKLGDIYQLGNHRLMCGDSTKLEDVEKLLDGELVDLVVTDPPYNVDIGITDLEEAKIRKRRLDGKTIQNDKMTSDEFASFLEDTFSNMNKALKPGGAYYIWFASRNHINFEEALNKNGLEVRQELIWVKNSLVMGRQDYQWKHEPCLYGWKEGAAHYFINTRKETTTTEETIDFDNLKKDQAIALLKEIYNEVPTTTIHEDKPSRSDIPPTMKPIKLIGRQVRNSSRAGEKVLDLFGGSGSTLIACEQLGRINYTMEYDPLYVDAIIERWEKFTGREAVKIS